MNLKNIKPSLENIISTMANLTNMEYAVFNTNSELVSSTQIYLQRKGRNVHSASIEEVLNLGNVIVNKPGLMNSCIGCRFVNNCPSTIEVLSCIKLNGIPVGVLSLTSFSQEGHTLIEENIRNYMNVLENTSQLISMFAQNEISNNNIQMLHKVIHEITKENNSSYIIIDKNGLLVHWDQEFEDLLSYCNLYTQTIDIIFPENICNWILSTSKPRKKYSISESFQGIIHITPLIIEFDIIGYFLKLEKDVGPSKQYLHQDYLDSIITNDCKINNIKNRIRKLSTSSSSVLITGKTGTGKELIAKAIHYTSNRSDNPFVSINCANIPDSLFESELFGYEEGAFTGAKKGGKLGIFEMANGGTVFLDEIGELQEHLQAKLLRVLQESTIQRLGSVTPISVDIRVIAATNQDLESMMEENRFREDLFYRLNVIPICLPPLNERIDDIELLTRHFINKYNKKLFKNVKDISKEALDILKSYPWPGNIRELENAIEYAINMEEADMIEIDNLPDRIAKFTVKERFDFKESIAQKEMDLIVSTLNKYGWNLSGKEKASEELGISIRTLYRKLASLEK